MLDLRFYVGAFLAVIKGQKVDGVRTSRSYPTVYFSQGGTYDSLQSANAEEPMIVDTPERSVNA